MSAITFENITKSHGEITPVKDFSLHVESGTGVCLFGAVGCGKTTLLRLAAGLNEPDSGRVLMDDKPVQDIPARGRGIGMVFQDFALWPHMSVRGHLNFVLKAKGIARNVRRERISEMLDFVELGERHRARPDELSGGQQRRLALARALVVDPDILILDEPFTNLDDGTKERYGKEIKRRKEKNGTTILIATHNRDAALPFVDRFVEL